MFRFIDRYRNRILAVIITAAFSALLMAGTVTTGYPDAAALSEKPSYTEEAPVIDSSLVKISCGDHYGCGNIFDVTKDRIVIVTALHVLEDAYGADSAGDKAKAYDGEREAEIILTFSDGKTSGARILKVCEFSDVAFLEVVPEGQGETISGDEAKNYTGISSASVDVSVLPDMTIFMKNAITGVTYAGSVDAPEVYSEDFGMDMILCYMDVDPGMSGTGVFDEEGHYLGMLLGATADGGAVCIRSADILSLYRES